MLIPFLLNMKNGNFNLLHLWLLGCLVYLGYVQKVNSATDPNYVYLTVNVHHLIPGSAPNFGVNTVTIKRSWNGVENMNASLVPDPTYSAHPTNGMWVFNSPGIWDWWQYASVILEINYQVEGEPTSRTQTYVRDIEKATERQTIEFIVYWAGPSGASNMWYYRDTVFNNLQVTMEVSYFNNVQGGKVLLGGPFMVYAGDTKSVMYGPFENPQDITTEVKFWDGELQVINESTNAAAWWSESGGMSDPSTNIAAAKMPSPPVAVSTNLGNIAWQTSPTNAGQSFLAQETSIRQGFENLKAISSQASQNDEKNFKDLSLGLSTINSNLQGIGALLLQAEQRETNRQSSMLSSSPVDGVLQEMINEAMGIGSNAMKSAYSPISGILSNVGPVAPYSPETITADHWKIHVQSHVIDCNPLNNEKVAAIFAALKSILSWLVRIGFLIANIWMIKYIVNSVWEWKQQKIINITVGGFTVNIVLYGLIIVTVFTILSAALGGMFGIIATNLGDGVFASLNQNAFTGESSLWQAVPGVITLVNAAIPISLFLGYLSAFVVSSLTIFGLALVTSGLIRAIPGN